MLPKKEILKIEEKEEIEKEKEEEESTNLTSDEFLKENKFEG